MARNPTRPDPTSNQPKERGRYAEEPELAPADRTLFETPTGREVSRKDVQPGDADEDDAPMADVGATPRSEETSDIGETEEGLDPTEEAVRRQAEDRPTDRDRS